MNGECEGPSQGLPENLFLKFGEIERLVAPCMIKIRVNKGAVTELVYVVHLALLICLSRSLNRIKWVIKVTARANQIVTWTDQRVYVDCPAH